MNTDSNTLGAKSGIPTLLSASDSESDDESGSENDDVEYDTAKENTDNHNNDSVQNPPVVTRRSSRTIKPNVRLIEVTNNILVLFKYCISGCVVHQ